MVRRRMCELLNSISKNDYYTSYSIGARAEGEMKMMNAFLKQQNGSPPKKGFWFERTTAETDLKQLANDCAAGLRTGTGCAEISTEEQLLKKSKPIIMSKGFRFPGWRKKASAASAY